MISGTRYQREKQNTAARIAGFRQEIATLKRRADAESIRADMAERRERSIAAERDIWKHQAQEAEAALRSAGVRR
ncbi:MAG: hypothetical protein JNK47_12920 [Mesorhizobium sp.]|nr:hypothetical protein [Mesorhizobium sp.]MBL8578122.1 hypothetical protein [Mesorhizobium sp.]